MHSSGIYEKKAHIRRRDYIQYSTLGGVLTSGGVEIVRVFSTD